MGRFLIYKGQVQHCLQPTQIVLPRHQFLYRYHVYGQLHLHHLFRALFLIVPYFSPIFDFVNRPKVSRSRTNKMRLRDGAVKSYAQICLQILAE